MKKIISMLLVGLIVSGSIHTNEEPEKHSIFSAVKCGFKTGGVAFLNASLGTILFLRGMNQAKVNVLQDKAHAIDALRVDLVARKELSNVDRMKIAADELARIQKGSGSKYLPKRSFWQRVIRSGKPRLLQVFAIVGFTASEIVFNTKLLHRK